MHHVEREPTIPKGRDNQPAGGQRRIRLAVAGRAQRDQSVQIEIGATLGALDDMVDLEPAASAAGLAAPPGTAPHLDADDLPLLGGRTLAPAGPWLIGLASPPPRTLQWFTPNRSSHLLPTCAKRMVLLLNKLNLSDRIAAALGARRWVTPPPGGVTTDLRCITLK